MRDLLFGETFACRIGTSGACSNLRTLQLLRGSLQYLRRLAGFPGASAADTAAAARSPF